MFGQDARTGGRDAHPTRNKSIGSHSLRSVARSPDQADEEDDCGQDEQEMNGNARHIRHQHADHPREQE